MPEVLGLSLMNYLGNDLAGAKVTRSVLSALLPLKKCLQNGT